MYTQKNLDYIFCWLVGLSNNVADSFHRGVLLGYVGALRDAEVITPEEFWRVQSVVDKVVMLAIDRGNGLTKKTVKKIFDETK